MTRPSHPGRSGGSGPFADAALTAATTAAERSLTETCSIGAVTSTTDPNPPYSQTTTFTAAVEDVPCSVEPADDREASVAGDPSVIAMFVWRAPRSTTVANDQVIEITAGRNTGSRFRVVEVHDSSTEPLLRATVERIDPGEA